MPHDDLLGEYETMRQAMLDWLKHTSLHRVKGCCSGKMKWVPSADIHETEKAYHLYVELAGVDPATIQVKIDENTLFLTGERSRIRIEGCTHIHQLEIDSGSFQRTFRFPASLDPEAAQSSFRQGILEVVVPKLDKPSAIQISLNSE